MHHTLVVAFCRFGQSMTHLTVLGYCNFKESMADLAVLVHVSFEHMISYSTALQLLTRIYSPARIFLHNFFQVIPGFQSFRSSPTVN